MGVRTHISADLRRRAPVNPLLRRRLVAVVAVGVPAMALIGLFLTGIGMLALRILGGVGNDTGLALMIAAFTVTDFWGGGLTAVAARADHRVAGAAWGIGRLVLLVLLALVGYSVAISLIQVALAVGAAALGAWIVGPERHEIAQGLRRRIEPLAERSRAARSAERRPVSRRAGAAAAEPVSAPRS